MELSTLVTDLKSFTISTQAIVWISLTGCALVLIASYAFYKKIKKRIKDLEALGLAKEKVLYIKNQADGSLNKKVIKRILKLSIKAKTITFTTYNPSFGLQDFENLKDKFETIYNIKIDGFSSEKAFWFWQQKKIIIHYNSFITYSIKEIPQISKDEMFCGVNSKNEPCTLDTVGDYENTVIILGPKNSGKSILTRTILYSFFKDFRNNHKFILVDFKLGNDYFDLLKNFNGELINPSTIKGLNRIIEILEENKKSFEAFLNKIADKKIQLKHFNLAHLHGLKQPQKYFFVFDECKQYLADLKEIKVSKESSEIEIEEYEKYLLKKKLAVLIDNFTDTQRLSGSVMILASQDSRSTAYSFNFTNFKTMFLGQQNKAQSMALTGSSIAEDKDLKQGKFIAIANGKIEKIQTPLFLKIED